MEPKSNTASAIDENRPESEGSATATATEAAPAAVESFTKVVQISSEENAARSRWAAYYRDELAKRLIIALQSTSAPNELAIWSMGKLFGYADKDVSSFIESTAVEEAGAAK